MNSESSQISGISKEFFRKHPRQFASLLGLLLLDGIISSLAVLALIPLSTYMIDPEFKNPSRIAIVAKDIATALGMPSNFWTYGFWFVGLNLVKGLFGIAIKHSTLTIKYSVTRGLLHDVLRAFFKARWEFFGTTDQGRLLSVLNKELVTLGDALGHLAQMLANVIQFAILLSLPFSLNPKLTFLTIFLSVLFGLPFLLLRKMNYRLGKKNVESAGEAMGILVESLAAARIILSFGRQEVTRTRYLAAFDKHVGITVRQQTVANIVPSFFRPLGMLAGIIAVGLSIHDTSQVAILAAVMWSLLQALALLALILQGHVDIKTFVASYDQFAWLKAQAMRVEEKIGSLPFKSLTKSIDLQNLYFEYPGRVDTLKGINLQIQAGQMTALVGESGSGKSTISDLILGLQIPKSGKVLIDGISLSDLNQNEFRERIGYVPQDPLLFQTSIRENLLWSVPSASEEEIWESLAQANAKSFVELLPQGLDTLVGDRGTKLSGGQRQRIALARALLRKPELLILDEATSSLDTESEVIIQDAIDSLHTKTTVLVIAHRLSTIARADKIYVLQRGQILETGSYRELSELDGGMFSRMVQLQLRSASH